jgi:hypothetical protein
LKSDLKRTVDIFLHRNTEERGIWGELASLEKDFDDLPVLDEDRERRLAKVIKDYVDFASPFHQAEDGRTIEAMLIGMQKALMKDKARE